MNLPAPKHAPARFRSYIGAHNRHIGQLRATGFIGADTLGLIAWPQQLAVRTSAQRVYTDEVVASVCDRRDESHHE